MTTTNHGASLPSGTQVWFCSATQVWFCSACSYSTNVRANADAHSMTPGHDMRSPGASPPSPTTPAPATTHADWCLCRHVDGGGEQMPCDCAARSRPAAPQGGEPPLAPQLKVEYACCNCAGDHATIGCGRFVPRCQSFPLGDATMQCELPKDHPPVDGIVMHRGGTIRHNDPATGRGPGAVSDWTWSDDSMYEGTGGAPETAPLTDALQLKAHLTGCDECSAGNYCDEGERYGGAVTHDYLTRITEGNGCRADAVSARVAAYRAAIGGGPALRTALSRLASTRSLTSLSSSSLDHNDWREELLARIEYARTSLAASLTEVKDG